ncbi:MAG: hypothetical protein IJ848_03505 [Alphaproteobacteria bacterium]|nr:hypothetical protein [Alphaproteobacteria bacterium]
MRKLYLFLLLFYTYDVNAAYNTSYSNITDPDCNESYHYNGNPVNYKNVYNNNYWFAKVKSNNIMTIHCKRYKVNNITNGNGSHLLDSICSVFPDRIKQKLFNITTSNEYFLGYELKQLIDNTNVIVVPNSCESAHDAIMACYLRITMKQLHDNKNDDYFIIHNNTCNLINIIKDIQKDYKYNNIQVSLNKSNDIILSNFKNDKRSISDSKLHKLKQLQDNNDENKNTINNTTKCNHAIGKNSKIANNNIFRCNRLPWENIFYNNYYPLYYNTINNYNIKPNNVMSSNINNKNNIIKLSEHDNISTRSNSPDKVNNLSSNKKVVPASVEQDNKNKSLINENKIEKINNDVITNSDNIKKIEIPVKLQDDNKNAMPNNIKQNKHGEDTIKIKETNADVRTNINNIKPIKIPIELQDLDNIKLFQPDLNSGTKNLMNKTKLNYKNIAIPKLNFDNLSITENNNNNIMYSSMNSSSNNNLEYNEKHTNSELSSLDNSIHTELQKYYQLSKSVSNINCSKLSDYDEIKEHSKNTDENIFNQIEQTYNDLIKDTRLNQVISNYSKALEILEDLSNVRNYDFIEVEVQNNCDKCFRNILLLIMKQYCDLNNQQKYNELLDKSIQIRTKMNNELSNVHVIDYDQIQHIDTLFYDNDFDLEDDYDQIISEADKLQQYFEPEDNDSESVNSLDNILNIKQYIEQNIDNNIENCLKIIVVVALRSMDNNQGNDLIYNNLLQQLLLNSLQMYNGDLLFDNNGLNIEQIYDNNTNRTHYSNLLDNNIGDIDHDSYKNSCNSVKDFMRNKYVLSPISDSDINLNNHNNTYDCICDGIQFITENDIEVNGSLQFDNNSSMKNVIHNSIHGFNEMGDINAINNNLSYDMMNQSSISYNSAPEILFKSDINNIINKNSKPVSCRNQLVQQSIFNKIPCNFIVYKKSTGQIVSHDYAKYDKPIKQKNIKTKPIKRMLFSRLTGENNINNLFYKNNSELSDNNIEQENESDTKIVVEEMRNRESVSDI